MADFPVRWGVLGPGRIAQRFAQCLPAVPGARLEAVASRDPARAQRFAQDHGAQRAHTSYEALLADPGVDAVYIATPHSEHVQWVLAAIEAGKPVLCEKPLTVNAAQAEAVFAAAAQRGVFVMEALWSRFLPVYEQVQSWLAAGEIGPLQRVEARFGFEREPDPEDRLYRLDLAGGALLDVGVYTLSLPHWLVGSVPLELRDARAHLGVMGVDEDVYARLETRQGVTLELAASMRRTLVNAMSLVGESGSIVIPDPFWEAQRAVLQRRGEPPLACVRAFEGNGFEYQVREVHACLAQGLLQSQRMPWADTLAVMRCMDSIRVRIGLRYPVEI
jgi:predicted dehydrogenase